MVSPVAPFDPLTLAPWPVYDAEQIAAAGRVLASGRVNYWSGLEGRRFEQDFAQACGCRHGVALANGSLALSSAYLALGLGSGDELITTPRSFVATASAAVLLGVRPLFADVDPHSQSITAASIAPLISPRTRAIAVVHLGGWPAPMEEILALAQAHGLAVIEDCAQAHGARRNGRPVGSFGDVAAWSFCQDKIISTAGEGGMVTTDRADLWDRVWSIKDHGKTWTAVHERQHTPGFRWLHERFGSNFRLTEVQAAIGRLQLQQLTAWHATRAAHAQALAQALDDLPVVRVPQPTAEEDPAWYRFYCFLRPEALAEGWSQARVLAAIAAAGVPAESGSCGEVYLERSFQEAGLAPAERLPVARLLADTSLAFQVHPSLSAAQIGACAERIRSVLQAAQR
ncbi:MAG: DegT/DnrJ/EryC1/StrS aminotransferase family protein [Cyanobacteriota bacterium]|nr:DegT/DnrJ/EryC1/StrS aminotransferase family protein [Cyanobacteriota bacterium]